jgi:hypothetical protein
MVNLTECYDQYNRCVLQENLLLVGISLGICTSCYNNNNNYYYYYCLMPVPVTALSKVYAYGCSPAAIVGSNPTGAWTFVCCVCCVLSGRGLCEVLITRSDESYRLWRVVVCDHETS